VHQFGWKQSVQLSRSIIDDARVARFFKTRPRCLKIRQPNKNAPIKKAALNLSEIGEVEIGVII
jgi:hypothetical protein